MTNKRKPLRNKSTVLMETMEDRTLFTAYSATLIAPVPLRTDTDFNTADATLVRNATTGMLYGFDNAGGTPEQGTVYQVDPATKALTVLTTFNTTNGPDVPLQLGIDSNGNIFGISQVSTTNGATGGGTLFELPVGNFANPVVLYTFPAAEFPAAPDGTEPLQMIVDSSNNIDILTGFGGTQNGGDVVQFQPGQNYATPNLIGTMPQDYHAAVDAFALAPDGTFFGTTGYAGANAEGTVWELPAGASVATNVASFDPTTTGAGPIGEMYVNAQDDVYGVVGGTGGSLDGVWEYNSSNQQLSLVAPFAGVTDEGTDPADGLIGDSTGNLYGTTAEGGSNGDGTFFEVDATTDAVTFSDIGSTANGTEPLGVPTADGAGNFYITTTFGAANGAGAVVEVSPGSSGGGGGGGGTTTTGTLSPVITKNTIPTSVVSGAKVTSAVTVMVSNTGTATSKAKDITLFASTDGVIDSTSIQLANVSKSFTLKAAKSTPVSVPVKTLNLLPAGTYTILAETTDTTGAVTSATTGPSVTVAAPFISISSAVGAVVPSLVKLGKSGAFKVTLTNSGNIASTGAGSIAIGLSDDGTTLSIPISSMKESPNLKVDKPMIITLHVKIPKTFTAAGSYFPFITFTQGTTTFTTVGTAPFIID